MLTHVRDLEPELDAIDGTVSIWYGPMDGPATYARHPDAAHYAASTMKTAVMVAAYRLAEAGRLSLDASIPVHDDFVSAAGTGTFCSQADNDSDPEPWARLGDTVPLRWLVERMIVSSSNLATNLVLERTGIEPVREVWELAGAHNSMVTRGIEDYAARAAGLTNLVTAADLAALLSALHVGRLAGHGSTERMIATLLNQQLAEDVVAGLPPGTAVAHKSGWVDGIRHNSALIFPATAPDYVQVMCISAPLSEEDGCALLARITAAIWADHSTR